MIGGTGMRNTVRSIVCALALVLSALPAHSQTAGQPSPDPNVSADRSKPASTKGSAWEFRLIPYTWMSSLDTKTTVRSHTADMKVPFSDILRDMNIAGQVHFEAQKGKWGFFIDPTYLKLSQDGTLRDGRETRVQIEQWLVEAGGMYRLGRWSLDGKGKRSMTVDALGGGRYWYLSANLDFGGTTNPSKSTQWVDPFLGARLNADITEKLLFNIRGDVGGFGVGSDFSWNALAVFGYRFTDNITGLLGYRALYVDYKAGTSSINDYPWSYSGAVLFVLENHGRIKVG
jgi:hypothetical protein